MPAILVTGANGEIGQNLLRALHTADPQGPLLALDLKEPVDAIQPHIVHAIQADIAADRISYESAILDYEVDTIFHLAALLSTAAERDPERAHRVNVNGTFALLSLAARISRRRGQPVKMVFPSSIAVYGVRDKQSLALRPIHEDEELQPFTMYGINKLYCEQLGLYYATHARLSDDLPAVDFRCVRLPGVISADTLPTGGTSDYAPEMIHAAAQGRPYRCFVRPDTTIPFMLMPDAVHALMALSDTPRERLARCVYNVTSFSVSAVEIAERVERVFPGTGITFAPDAQRQAIVDTWPAAIDDSAARREWGWSPQYNADAIEGVLAPRILERYRVRPGSAV